MASSPAFEMRCHRRHRERGGHVPAMAERRAWWTAPIFHSLLTWNSRFCWHCRSHVWRTRSLLWQRLSASTVATVSHGHGDAPGPNALATLAAFYQEALSRCTPAKGVHITTVARAIATDGNMAPSSRRSTAQMRRLDAMCVSGVAPLDLRIDRTTSRPSTTILPLLHLMA